MKTLLCACLVAGLVLGAGCAHTPSAPTQASATSGPTGQFSFQSAEGAYTVNVTPTELSGPNYQVSRYPDALRGQVDGQAIDLEWTQQGVQGTYGSQPINLKLEPTQDGTRVSGMWGGRIGNLVVGAKSVDGRIGRCSYTLGRTGEQLSGQSTCGGAPSNTSITLPSGLATPLDGQSAAVLALLLGQ